MTIEEYSQIRKALNSLIEMSIENNSVITYTFEMPKDDDNYKVSFLIKTRKI